MTALCRIVTRWTCNIAVESFVPLLQKLCVHQSIECEKIQDLVERLEAEKLLKIRSGTRQDR